MTGRAEEPGPESDQVTPPATLRVKWQKEEEGLRLVCGEVGRSGGSEREGVGPGPRTLGVGMWSKGASK